MKYCTNCKKPLEEKQAKTPEGFSYGYYVCTNCGEEIVNMKQLRRVAEQYRVLKKVKLSRWGVSLGLRIPKDLVVQYGFKEKDEVTLIPDKDGIRVVQA